MALPGYREDQMECSLPELLGDGRHHWGEARAPSTKRVFVGVKPDFPGSQFWSPVKWGDAGSLRISRNLRFAPERVVTCGAVTFLRCLDAR